MIHWRIVCAAVILCGIYTLGAALVFAATDSDEFTVTQTISTPDPTPPTTPQNLTATSVSSSQLDLDWDASSDNVAVDGYQVFRDSAQIATTSQNNYSDIGLTASTTYVYYVTAFDAVGNISSSSATATATTQSAPTTPTDPEAQLAESTRVIRELEITDLSYSVTPHSIELAFNTNQYARARVSWGRTSNHELGYSSSDVFRREHTTTINGLDAGTVYEIEIALVDIRLMQEYRETRTIVTDLGPDTVAPANVTELRAVHTNGIVDLSWSNPSDVDLSHVRVLSSDFFYPTHTADGWLVYEGADEAVEDDRHLPDGARRFYTVYSYDHNGNVSSGAVTMVSRIDAGESNDATDSISRRVSTTTGTITDIARPAGASSFTFDDIIFMQDGAILPNAGGEVYLDAEVNTRISLPYELLPERLKTIVVTLAHPTDHERVFSFLLRINADRSAYEATIGPLEHAGIYRFTTDLYDYKTTNIERAEGEVVVSRKTIRDLTTGGFESLTPMLVRYVHYILLIVLALLMLLFLFRRRRQTEDRVL